MDFGLIPRIASNEANDIIRKMVSRSEYGSFPLRHSIFAPILSQKRAHALTAELPEDLVDPASEESMAELCISARSFVRLPPRIDLSTTACPRFLRLLLGIPVEKHYEIISQRIHSVNQVNDKK